MSGHASDQGVAGGAGSGWRAPCSCQAPTDAGAAPRSVRISALALLKMAMHAKSGGNIEVMGVMQGKVLDDTFVVMDAFALPVEGTETRVNAQAEGYEYMVDFLETNKVRSSRFIRSERPKRVWAGCAHGGVKVGQVEQGGGGAEQGGCGVQAAALLVTSDEMHGGQHGTAVHTSCRGVCLGTPACSASAGACCC